MPVHFIHSSLIASEEIMENGKNYEILTTNLQTSFWRKLKSILRQNKKIALLQFLFGSQDSIAEPDTQNHLNEKIERLQNQVNFLQQKVIQLEQNQRLDLKYARRGTLESPEATKSIQQGDSTSKSEKGAYLGKNDSKANSEVREDSNVLSAAKISPLKTLSNSQQYNIALNQDKGLNDSNFITLGKISEEDKIQIIQTGFRLSQEGKISLKKYYESKDPDSLFQWKKYSIKYESVRRTKLYQSIKK